MTKRHPTNSPAETVRSSIDRLKAQFNHRVVGALAASTSLVLTSACASAPPRSNVADDLETPAYVELERSGEFELRRVDPYIVAATTVAADDLDAASRQGFRILADYIFGNNVKQQSVAMTAPVSTSPTATNEKIAMTAPVSTAPVANEEIAMTAPVSTSPVETSKTNMSSNTKTEKKAWNISFMMPSEYTLESLPTPKDERVRFEKRPEICQAVVVFSGFTTKDAVSEKTDALRAWLSGKGIEATDGEILARYNDPFTFPWNRRNEVVVTLSERACDALGKKENDVATATTTLTNGESNAANEVASLVIGG